jgi:hypothetical protein
MTGQSLATTVPLGPALAELQAREIDRQGEEAVVFALLTLAQMRAEPHVSKVTDFWGGSATRSSAGGARSAWCLCCES